MGKKLHYRRSVRLSDHRVHPVTVRTVDPVARTLDVDALRRSIRTNVGAFDPREV